MPDLFSRIYAAGVHAFEVVDAEVDALYEAAVKVVPGLAPVVAAEKSALKQQLSNAMAFAKTEEAAHYADAVSMVESACDTFLVRMTGGAAVLAIPFVNGGLTMGFDQLRAVIDHAEIAAQARLQMPPPTSAAQPTLAGVAQAAVGALAPAS